MNAVFNTLINILTNQFFLLFLTVATGLWVGKIKLGNFSLGVSGGIFTGIVIGYAVMRFAHASTEGQPGYDSAARILKAGLIQSSFFMFFLLMFLCAIGLGVGKNITHIFRHYGIKFVIIGVVIPVFSMLVAFGSYKILGASVSGFETLGMYTGAMTTTPGYGAALEAVGRLDMKQRYLGANEAEKRHMSKLLSGKDEAARTGAEVPAALDAEQAVALKKAAASATSLGYTVAFPVGVIVIVLLMTFLPRIFRIDIEEEKRQYAAELAATTVGRRKQVDAPFDMLSFGAAAVAGILLGGVSIPLGTFGSFSLGAAGGVLIVSLVLSSVGRLGPLNFRMDSRALGIVRDMGLTFFMADAGLSYGYDVVMSLTGSGLLLAALAVLTEGLAVLGAFLIGRKLFKLNWVILSGAISGGCTSAPGLGAAISTVGGSDEPSAGYGAAQPFAILANVLLSTIFFNLIF